MTSSVAQGSTTAPFRAFARRPLAWLLSACLIFPGNASLAGDAGFTLHLDEPALGRGPNGSWDSAYVDPGTAIFHDGAFHMFYVAIPRWPHPLAIGYAKSTDGSTWNKHSDGPILTPDQTGAISATSIVSNSALVTEDGTWVLYFTSVAQGENFYGEIIRATAPGPLGPWTVDPEPALTAGADEAWDGVAVGDASVVQTQDGYAMYYAGFGQFQNGALSEKRANIGLATSADGVNWTKFDNPDTTDALFGASDPVLSVATGDAAWDSFRLVDPNVQKTAEGWQMAYRGNTFDSAMAVGLATSEDGITWARPSDQPAITKQDAGHTIYFISLLSRPEQDYLYLELGSLDRTDAFLATRPKVTQ